MGVAALEVLAGACRVHAAAVRALHAVQLTAQGLEGDVDASVGADLGRVLVDIVDGVTDGQSLVFDNLGRRSRVRGCCVCSFDVDHWGARILALVVRESLSEELIHDSSGGTSRAGGTRWTRLSRGSLGAKEGT